MLCQLYQAVSFTCGDARVLCKNANSRVRVSLRQIKNRLAEFFVIVYFSIHVLRENVDAVACLLRQ